jgi:hypothetical protein
MKKIQSKNEKKPTDISKKDKSNVSILNHTLLSEKLCLFGKMICRKPILCRGLAAISIYFKSGYERNNATTCDTWRIFMNKKTYEKYLSIIKKNNQSKHQLLLILL